MPGEPRTSTKVAKYRGHRIEVTAREQRSTAWSWTYSIDDKVYGRNPTSGLMRDAEAALDRALLAARARIDSAL